MHDLYSVFMCGSGDLIAENSLSCTLFFGLVHIFTAICLGCDANSALVLVLPYLTAEYINNKTSFENYYDEIEVFESSHFRSAFQQRNRAMVDRSDLVICCIERDEGGAYNAVRYAQKTNKKVMNVAYRAEMQERLDRVFDDNNDDKTQS